MGLGGLPKKREQEENDDFSAKALEQTAFPPFIPQLLFIQQSVIESWQGAVCGVKHGV